MVPSASARQSGTPPYSSTTGEPSPVLYSAWPWRILRPAGGSQVRVPPLRPITGNDPAYPSVAACGVVADSSCWVTSAVPGAGSPGSGPDEAAGVNTPAHQAASIPPATTTTMARAAQPPRRAWCRDTVSLTVSDLTGCRGARPG